MSVIGWGLVAVFAGLASLHLYWGFGGLWPGHDADSLRRLVVGTHSGPMFGLAACAAVAAALASAAALVGAGHSRLASGGFAFVVIAGYAAMILIFGARGLAPYVSSVFEYSRGTPFFDLNRLYYAPLCLAIAAALGADLLSVLSKTASR